MTKTLLVDGNNLLKIGFHGVKDFYNNGEHIGGTWHFLNTIRKFLEETNFNKVMVFWDSDTNSSQRKLIYPKYKMNRKSSPNDEEKTDSFNKQKTRVKQYLEEMFIRQSEVENSEADDLIAHYCKVSPDEEKTIFSSDGDLTQLVSETTQIYNPSHGKIYKQNDTIVYDHEEILIENVKLVKMMCGDSSDNIAGIRGMGVKRFLSLFPELRTEQISIEQVKDKCNVLFEQDKTNRLVTNLLTGVTKHGVFGDEFFDVNSRIVSLDDPFLTDEAKQNIDSLINENLDPDGRSYKNTMKMMMEDGLFKYLPKDDEAWVNFLTPFTKLIRKEKRNTNKN